MGNKWKRGIAAILMLAVSLNFVPSSGVNAASMAQETQSPEIIEGGGRKCFHNR